MKKTIIIHPFLFAVFPILFLISHNISQMSFSEALMPTAIVLGFTLLLLLSSGLIFKDNKKTGIIVSIFLILFFSYGHIFNVIEGREIGSFTIGRNRYLLLTWGMLFTCGAYFIIKTRKNLHNFTNFLNMAAASLVMISLINISYEFKTRVAWRENRSMVTGKLTAIDLEKTDKLRDIYYIILDGYASSSTLKEIYGYNNHEFTDYLTEKGFYITSESRSNYAMTFLSLASSLNMEYLNYLTDIVGLESKNRKIPYQMIENSKVMNFLKSKGYRFIHFSSGWGPTDCNKYADFDVRCGRWNEFLVVLIQTTMLRSLEGCFIKVDARARILYAFSKLAEVYRIEGPKFVFAHINSPHPPYVFGANGEPVPETKLKMSGNVWEQKENYLNQLIFVNKKVKMLVDEILSKSEVSPIVILQADHGPSLTFYRPDSEGWDYPIKTNLRERMRIFNAYYLPTDGDDLLYDSITPVNTFRLVFNFYFNTNYELLNDLSYYSTYERPYKFINVTDKLKYD